MPLALWLDEGKNPMRNEEQIQIHKISSGSLLHDNVNVKMLKVISG